MDHDALEARLAKVERFLDAQAPGWQDQARWLRPGRDAGLIREPLRIDEDQTAHDREVLGLPVDGGPPIRRPGEFMRVGIDDSAAQNLKSLGPGSVKPVEDGRRTFVLAQLEPYRGVDGVAPWDGTESTDQLEGILTTARARQAGGGMSVAQAVTIGAANASPEANAALQTHQDPARAERAAEQRDAKIAGEAAGGAPQTIIRDPLLQPIVPDPAAPARPTTVGI